MYFTATYALYVLQSAAVCTITDVPLPTILAVTPFDATCGKINGIKVTTKKYRMTLEENSYAGGHLGRIQIPQEDLDNYGTIVGTSFGGSSTAPRKHACAIRKRPQ